MPPPESAPFTLRDHTRNLVWNCLHEAFWGFGVAFHTTYAVLPLFLRKLGAPDAAVGSLMGIFIVGAAVPQLLSAFLGRRVRNLKKTVVIVHLLILPPVLVSGLVFALLGPTGPGAWKFFFALYIIYTLVLGLVFPIWADFLDAAHLKEKRGVFWGATFACHSIAGFFGGIAVKKLLSGPLPFPTNFGACLLIFAASVFAATLLFLFYRLKPAPALKDNEDFPEFLARVKTVLRFDGNFRSYLTSRMILAAHYPAVSLYAIHCQDRLGFDVSEAGVFISTAVGVAVLSSLAMGRFGDHHGHKKAMVIVYCAYLGALVTALLTTRMAHAYLVFALLGVGQGGFNATAMSLVYEFASGRDAKVYYALIDTVTAPATILFLLLSAAIVGSVGSAAALLVAAFCVAAGILHLAAVTREPRRAEAVGPATEFWI